MSRLDRIDYIDALRGIAAMAVVLHHFGGPVIENLGFDFGRYGVLLFFVISGYVIPYSLTARHSHPLTFFGLSRFFRLYPAYWLSILLMLWIGSKPIDGLQMAANLTMVQRFLGIEDIQGVYWTLAVELAFYFGCLFLFLARVLDRLKRLMIVLAALSVATIMAAALRATYGIPLPFAWLGFLSLMMGGAVLRRLDEEGKRGGTFLAAGVVLFLAVHGAALTLVYIDPVH